MLRKIFIKKLVRKFARAEPFKMIDFDSSIRFLAILMTKKNSLRKISSGDGYQQLMV